MWMPDDQETDAALVQSTHINQEIKPLTLSLLNVFLHLTSSEQRPF